MMNENVRLLFEELKDLGYEPEYLCCQLDVCTGEGARFTYEITDGSRSGESVLLGLVIPETASTWPEGTPHWIHISPPDSVLEEQVQAHRGNAQGNTRRYTDQEGVEWLLISAPVKDFWDQIEEPNGKNMSTYLERHIKRIWSYR